MIKPIDIPTAATAAFIESNLPGGAAIVEVGCGAGDVATLLAKRGFRVVGLDSDEELVAQARQRKVEVVHASWPDFKSELVDAVVFTRSLHHISPLPEAVAKIRELLKPAGTVLVEDFAFDEIESPAIQWFLKIVKSRKGQSLIAATSDAFITMLLNSGDAEEAWQQNHDHELHTATEMTAAIGEEFTIRDTRRVPYLYRYLVPVLPQTREAAAFIEEAFLQEARLGEIGEIALIGHRIVAEFK